MSPEMTVMVGSLNPNKIAAAARVVARIWPEASVRGVAAPSGISIQPLTDDESILGARNRAEFAVGQAGADYGVGIEGNVADSPFGMFVTAWAVVVDGAGETGIGAGGRFLLPEPLAAQVRTGAELGPLMDSVIGERNTKHRQGAVGILTGGLIRRDEALETAVTFALTRFIVPEFYRD